MFKKIMIPTDGSVLGKIAAAHGIDMAAKLGAEVVGINVVREYKPGFGMTNSPVAAEAQAAAKEDGVQALKPLQEAAAKAGVKFSSVMPVANHPAQAIVRAASEQACDMIFIGSNGCAGWDNVLMGSVSNKVLATAHIPVLVYRLKKEEIPAGVPQSYEIPFPG